LTAALRRAAARALLLAMVPIAVGGCSGVPLTPAAISGAPVPEDVRRDVVATWREAVALANDFLASPFRATLPAGRFELADDAGMRFVTDAGSWPIAVYCTPWGDVCVAFGFAAQEREWGFVVGSMAPERDRLVDNSLFVYASGWRKPARDVADLVLHETTHVVWREGTIGFWNGVAYYLETIFLFRYSNHSDERRANATDEEFAWFFGDRELRSAGAPFDAADAAVQIAALQEARARHLTEERDTCRHGPFEEAPPAPPEPAKPSPSQDPR
jgi:hypothetical protein